MGVSRALCIGGGVTPGEIEALIPGDEAPLLHFRTFCCHQMNLAKIIDLIKYEKNDVIRKREAGCRLV